MRGSAETVVVRFGPLATEFASWRERIAAQLVQLRQQGKQVVVVHGGGPRVDEFLARLGQRPRFDGGHAVLDEAAFHVHEMVATAVGKDIVAAVQANGGRALGISGRDAAILLARRTAGHGASGEVVRADAEGLREILADGFLPVITAIANDDRGEGLLVKPDDAAGAIAAALRAETLVMLDTTDGVWAHGHRVRALDRRGVDLLVSQDAVPAALATELGECVDAVEGGAAQARIVDVRRPDALLEAADPAADAGTVVRPAA